MLYVLTENGKAISATTEYTADFRYQSRHDWKTMERAEQIAAQLTEATGTVYLATDAGPNCSPRFDVVAAPVLGATVSKGFNGDYYPEGEIVKISASFKRIETSTGAVFTRRKLSGAWVQSGTWVLVPGTISERNPSF